MERYPHILTIIPTTESGQDENGNWVDVESPETTTNEYACRDEVNLMSRSVQLTDGKATIYSSMIYLPATEHQIKAGDTIEVKDIDGNLRLTGSVLRITNDRKNTRIWV